MTTFSELEGPDFDATIQGVDLVCVTDWNREGLVSGFVQLVVVNPINIWFARSV